MALTPLKAYTVLLSRFGQQGWWPLSGSGEPVREGDKDYANYLKAVPAGTEEDFQQNWPRHIGIAPETSEQCFEVMVGAVLTQNTAWANVEKALTQLKRQKLLSVSSIACAPLRKIQEAVRPAGYFRQKAAYLKGIAGYVQKKYCRDLARMFSQPTGALRYELLSLKGIGPETADSIMLYAAGKPRFVVDAYTQRAGRRLGWPVGSYAETQALFEKSLQQDVKLYREYHALLIELGKTACRKKPLCWRCPLKKQCPEGQAKNIEARR